MCVGEEEGGVRSPGSRIPIWSTKWDKHRRRGLGLVPPPSLTEEAQKEGAIEGAEPPRPCGLVLESQGELLRVGEGGGAGLCFFISFFFVVVFVGSSLFSSFGSFLYKGKQAFLKNNKRGKKKSLLKKKKP